MRVVEGVGVRGGDPEYTPKPVRPKQAPKSVIRDVYPGVVRKRRTRCLECPACLRSDDCGACEFCR